MMTNERKILLPDARDIRDVFMSALVIESLTEYRAREVHVWDREGHPVLGSGRAVLTSFCAVSSSSPNLDVHPKREVVAAIEKGMPIIGGYRISFQITFPESASGKALVLAKYESILGSRFLAEVDPFTIPGISASRGFDTWTLVAGGS